MTKASRIRVGVVLRKNNEILVIRMHRENGDIFVLPGGGLEVGEGIIECAKREVKEETGLTIELHKILYLKDLVTATDHALEMVILGNITGGYIVKGFDPENKGCNILKEVTWISVDELKNLNFHPKQLREALPTAFKSDFADATTYLGKFQYPE
ncbi:MAG: NUDIX domain-containing protein [Nanoarchaeota archaeon]